VIRLLIADDEELIRIGLRTIFARQPDIEVVADVQDGAAAVDAVRRLQVDVALMDIRMAGGGGLDAARRLSSGVAPASVRVLLFTTFDLDEYIDEALAIGASGFLLKSASPEELVAAVRAAAAGQGWLSPSVTRRVIEAFARRRLRMTRDPVALAVLTDREREVLRHLARGLSNREIAGELGVGENTVRTHVGHVLMKLNLRDRTQAVVLAHESGLLDT